MPTSKHKPRHFLTGEELSQAELQNLLDASHNLKERSNVSLPLRQKTWALVFDKPSLRTRISFTVGIQELGGSTIEVNGTERKNEDPEDVIRVLQGYVDGVMIRTFAHADVEKMAKTSRIPIVNGLSDLHHPCQALADLQALQERWGRLRGKTLAFVGDGNNVLHSLLLLLPFVGVSVHYSCPQGYSPDAEILKRAHKRAEMGGAHVREFATAKEACAGVDAVYTDVWISMGFESTEQQRLAAFGDFQVNAELLQNAKPEALIMHCMPINKGQEMTADLIEHQNSIVFEQSENRLHAQKALLIGLYGKPAEREIGIAATP